MPAYIFPGQGSQFLGMGVDLVERFDVARRTFEKADAVLGYSLREVCFNGPEERLEATGVQQPAILTVSIAALRALEGEGKVSPERAQTTCGLSLGEYSALVFAGALSFEDALTVVARRGGLMEEAGRKRKGGMLSVLGLDLAKVEAICREAGPPDILVVANRNCPGQAVISGDVAAVERAERMANERGADRVVRLRLSEAFHSPLMASVQEGLAEALTDVNLSPPRVPFISNVTGGQEDSPDRIKELLVKQVCSAVLWEQSMRTLIKAGAKEFVEVGPGNVLKGLLKRIDREVVCVSAGTVEAIEAIERPQE